MVVREVPVKVVLVVLALSAVWLLSAPAAAQYEFGVRAGVSGGPDQFYFGGHIETPPLVDHVRFRPNVEIGLGDDTTLVAINIEFVYRAALSRPGWDVYAGGGPAANRFSYAAWKQKEAGIEPGLNLVAGVAHRDGLFAELKVGVADSPSVKVAVGFAWD